MEQYKDEHRARQVIAHGALTNSKRPESFVRGIYPTHVTTAYGATLLVDDKRYIDYICALGAIILGYDDYKIVHAISSQASLGTIHSLPTRLEIETAELVNDFFPVMERLRFLKTGSEACSAAIKIARASTGRSKVVSHGYHGWHDNFVSLTEPHLGTLNSEALGIYKYDQSTDYSTASDIACIIVEPELLGRDTLIAIRAQCTKAGILLIFDETISGLRYPEGSYYKFVGIHPDILILGKAIGAGMPLSIVGGKKEIMESDYFVSSTFAGDTISLAACKKLLELHKTNHWSMEVLYHQAQHFMTQFNVLTDSIVQIKPYGAHGKLEGEQRDIFMQEMCKVGFLFGKSFFYNVRHHEHLENTLSVIDSVCRRIKSGSVVLQGERPVDPFPMKIRQGA